MISEPERDRTVKALTRHCGDGRITLEELETRIEAAYAASSNDELRELLRDLPATTTPAVAPSFAPAPHAVAVAHRPDKAARDTALRVHAVVFLSVMAFLVAIYLLTDPFGYFWPIWPAMGWGTGLAIHAGAHKAIWSNRT